jgi:hypothetical protein
MPKKNGVSYKVSRNGSAGDWYWEAISDRKSSIAVSPPREHKPARRASRLPHPTRPGSQRIPRHPSKVSRL